MVLKWFLSISINYCVDLTENVYQDNFAGMWSGNFSKKKPGYLPGFLILWWALRDSNPEPRDYESIFKTEFKCRNVNHSVDSSG